MYHHPRHIIINSVHLRASTNLRSVAIVSIKDRTSIRSSETIGLCLTQSMKTTITMRFWIMHVHALLRCRLQHTNPGVPAPRPRPRRRTRMPGPWRQQQQQQQRTGEAKGAGLCQLAMAKSRSFMKPTTTTQFATADAQFQQAVWWTGSTATAFWVAKRLEGAAAQCLLGVKERGAAVITTAADTQTTAFFTSQLARVVEEAQRTPLVEVPPLLVATKQAFTEITPIGGVTRVIHRRRLPPGRTSTQELCTKMKKAHSGVEVTGAAAVVATRQAGTIHRDHVHRLRALVAVGAEACAATTLFSRIPTFSLSVSIQLKLLHSLVTRSETVQAHAR